MLNDFLQHFGQFVWVAIFSFLLGSVPFGLIITKIFGSSDLRTQGSGNIGATNVSRVLGFWPAGFLTLVLDLAKGAIPVALAKFTDPFSVFHLGITVPWEASSALAWSSGLWAVWGHCFTPWLKFKGGKGVATGLGALLVLDPLSALTGIVFFALAFAINRVGAIASLSGLFGILFARWITGPFSPDLWWGALMIWTVIVRHNDNLDRLLGGNENAFR